MILALPITLTAACLGWTGVLVSLGWRAGYADARTGCGYRWHHHLGAWSAMLLTVAVGVLCIIGIWTYT